MQFRKVIGSTESDIVEPSLVERLMRINAVCDKESLQSKATIRSIHCGTSEASGATAVCIFSAGWLPEFTLDELSTGVAGSAGILYDTHHVMATVLVRYGASHKQETPSQVVRDCG